MKPIKILPHHAVHFFEVFYLGMKPENGLSWYDDETMKQNGVNTINTVITNPEQLVQIVDTYDETCRMCPKNKQGKNYNTSLEDTCHNYDTPHSDGQFPEILGLEKVMNQPISAKAFFELMKPTYERLMAESEYDTNNKRKTLHQIFRVPMKISNFGISLVREKDFSEKRDSLIISQSISNL